MRSQMRCEVRSQVWRQVCSEVRSQMRREELIDHPATEPGRETPVRLAAEQVLGIYRQLAVDGAHLLGGLMQGGAPLAWEHYPQDDARDEVRGYQWFYHSHSASDRPGATEHGHFHIFARKPAIGRCLDAKAEAAWRMSNGYGRGSAKTRHLLCLGIDAKGVPNTLFTVNSWVTGDAMASAEGTVRLLENLKLDTGHPSIDRLITAVVALHADAIADMMLDRDRVLLARARKGPGAPQDKGLEVLSEVGIDLDQTFANLF